MTSRARALAHPLVAVALALPPSLAAATVARADDPLVAQQQAQLAAARLPQAWALPELALDTLGPVRVGVVDTGLVRAHEELGATDAGGFDFVSDAAVAGDGDGRDADYAEEAPADAPLAHGSHVAGIIAAPGDNGRGVAGVHWRARIVSARALGANQAGNSIDIMDAARWLAGLHVDGVDDIGEPVDIINFSVGFADFGARGCAADTQDTIDEIVGLGVVVVAAAGNHGAPFGTDDAQVLAPAACEGVISVGALDFAGAQTAYSNDAGGGRVDLMAPGGTQTFNEGVVSLGNGPDAYAAQFGTSMAAPHVSGVAALMLDVDPTLTPERVRELLLALPSTCSDCAGRPTLDAEVAVRSVIEGAPLGGPGGCGCASTSLSPPLPFIVLLVALARRMRRRLLRRARRPGALPLL